MDLNKCEITSAGNIRTPKCRLAFLFVHEPVLPYGETDEAKRAFFATPLFPAAADLTLLKDKVNEFIAANWVESERGSVKKPFRKTAERKSLAAYAGDFPVCVTVSAKPRFRPQVVGGDMQPINDPSQMYSGRWGLLALRPYKWTHKTGGTGVSLGLVHVQLLDHDEPMGGGRNDVEDDFTPIAGVASSTPTSTEGLFD
jgi:hypothetical protein